MTLACAVAALSCGAAAGAAGAQEPGAGDGSATVTVAIVPNGTELAALEAVPDAAVGLLSPGIGFVPSFQTYLDVTQGNRLSQALYDPVELPGLRLRLALPDRVPRDVWGMIRRRADRAPAEVVPGLLATTLREAGMGAVASPAAGTAALLAVDERGRIELGDRPAPERGLFVTSSKPGELAGIVRGLRGDDLLIAIERPPARVRLLTIAMAGSGFSGGRLISSSTRTRGLVTATDLAPTILERLGVRIPSEMNGEPVRAEGEAKSGSLLGLAERYEETSPRRGPVVGQNLLIWLALIALATLVRGRAGARAGLRLLGPAVAWLPLMLLVTGALSPSLTAERLIVGLGCPALALVVITAAPGWRAMAIPALASVSAFAMDLVADWDLIQRALIGPNPAAGSRFYGIGNEIEATLGALLPLGLGAALAAHPKTREGGRRAAIAFLAASAVAAVVFAAGRFGADVGAAIVFPTAGAAGAVVALGSRRGAAPLLLAPFAGLALLAVVDLVAGGGAHLTRSVLEAGGLEQAGDVFERRIRLAARTFERGDNLPYLVLAAGLGALALRNRRAVRSWFAERAAWAGFAGAGAATAIGTVSNDSGAILLILGGGFLAVTAGYAWATREEREAGRP